MPLKKKPLPPYQVDSFNNHWAVYDTSSDKAVIQNVTLGTAEQYNRLLNEAFEKGYQKGVDDSPKVEFLGDFKFPSSDEW